MAGIKQKDLKDQLDWYSSTISNAVRTTSFGVIAAIWAIFTANGLSLGETGLFGASSQLLVRLAFVFASGALLSDILQYVSAYWMTSIGYDKYEVDLENDSSKKFFYNKECLGSWGCLLYSLGFVLFPLKLVLAIFSAFSFLFLAFGVSIDQS